MLDALDSDSVESSAWLGAFVNDFRLRFTTLLAGAYRAFPPALALSILDPRLTFVDTGGQEAVEVRKSNGDSLTAYDFKRLQACCNPPQSYTESCFQAECQQALRAE